MIDHQDEPSSAVNLPNQLQPPIYIDEDTLLSVATDVAIKKY